MTTHLHLAPDPDGLCSDSGTERAIRVMLADDHALMRRSLRRVLETEEGIEVLPDVADLQRVVRDAHRDLPSVLVLDLRMPGGSSIDVIRELREQLPSTQIVALTMNDTPGFALQALDAGAVGFVLQAMRGHRAAGSDPVRRPRRGVRQPAGRGAARRHTATFDHAHLTRAG